MKKTKFFVILLVGLFLVACSSGERDGVTVEDVWGRSAPMSASNAAFYMTINNAGQEQDSLVAASISICDVTELHMSSIDDNGVMSMRQVQQIDVPAGETKNLEPGGLHIMCIGRQADLNPGDSIPISLSFARAGEIAAEANIKEP